LQLRARITIFWPSRAGNSTARWLRTRILAACALIRRVNFDHWPD
jgi:hypothetical protein